MKNRKETANSIVLELARINFLSLQMRKLRTREGKWFAQGQILGRIICFLSLHFLTSPFPHHESALEGRLVGSPTKMGLGRHATQEGPGSGKGRSLRSLTFFRKSLSELQTDQVSGVLHL